MLNCSTVAALLVHLKLNSALHHQVASVVGEERASDLLTRLGRLPLIRSHAATRLGSYSFRGSRPRSIRLQFTQEVASLRQTFLHEIAHFLDHQTRDRAGDYSQPHGRGWQHWLELIGGQRGAAGSVAMRNLYQQRLKPVARCKRCGALFKRLKRLSQGQRWLHRNCGGQLLPLD